ncbi:glutathione S-transferase family protein [Wenzhouxiangella marina]|uniref:Glutathione S-transferase domain-containing protein n=1 Tax=Wenzhouxiangella marina TaxID=1579979 RepID=A0A0K0XUN9_9GAMM|nr:glutathione S-transferase [Wenzhouxiangella marina]AKS41398.1 Glutathione S-transferase domain-containing protein [Wenzhouxiangella marina]MBB6086848.1 glutathione S-transferase [Wenzhouxiangella marina]
MRLYGSTTSPYVRHCRIVLAQTELEHEFVETDYTESALRSPTARVPFLDDGELRLHDSASILRHLRERAGQVFMPDIQDYETFLLANTGLDASVNLFLLEKEGLTPAKVPYLARQAARVESVLAELDARCAQGLDTLEAPFSDGQLRVGCYLSWAAFRERFAIDGKRNLEALMVKLDADPVFAGTHPSLLV